MNSAILKQEIVYALRFFVFFRFFFYFFFYVGIVVAKELCGGHYLKKGHSLDFIFSSFPVHHMSLRLVVDISKSYGTVREREREREKSFPGFHELHFLYKQFMQQKQSSE
jgi:hypothetical protein